MFEVIISQVRTGRVTRQLFDTLEEAEARVRLHEELVLHPPRGRKPGSLRNYRVELRYCELPRIHRLDVAGRTSQVA